MRLTRPAFGFERVVQKLELLERFGLSLRFRQLVRQHEPDVILAGTEVRELLQRPERIVHLAESLHAVGVLEEILLRVAR